MNNVRLWKKIFQKDYVNKLERQIVLADSQVCSAILTLLQQELTGYVRGGWILRKAWRVYQHAYTQISQLYRRTFGTNPTGASSHLQFQFERSQLQFECSSSAEADR